MTTPTTGSFCDRSAAERVRFLRLVNAPIDAPVGSRAYEKRVQQRQILLRYDVGGHDRKAVADALGLSVRQFYRERRTALEWVNAGVESRVTTTPREPPTLFDAERLVLERLAPQLAFADAKRRFEILLSRTIDATARASAHLAYYEFLSVRDERTAIRREHDSLHRQIAVIDDAPARQLASGAASMVDAQVAWRDGEYATALNVAGAIAHRMEPLAETGRGEHAAMLCGALQLTAQLHWETGDATKALSALDEAKAVIDRHRLGTRACAVTNSVGRADVLMRSAVRVPEAICVAALGFDQAATFGDAEDAAGALLIIAMARCAQRRMSDALEYASYAHEYADEIAPVGRARLLIHIAEIHICQRNFARARLLLDRAEPLLPRGSTADAQRQLRVALLAAALGAPVDALVIVNEAIASLEGKAAHRFIGPALKIRAGIRWAVQDRVGCQRDLEDAVSCLRGESYAWTYAQALHDFGRVSRRPAIVREAAALRAVMDDG